MSNLLKEKCSLAKLREELEGKRGKLCRHCKKFGHLVHNCRNGKEREKGTVVSQNKFEVLRSSRVMQCGVEERTIRRQEMIVVECYKCGEVGHKCRECPLWKKAKEEKRRVEERAVHVATPQKAQQEGKLVRPIREKVQETERILRRAEEEKAVCMAKPQDTQQG